MFTFLVLILSAQAGEVGQMNINLQESERDSPAKGYPLIMNDAEILDTISVRCPGESCRYWTAMAAESAEIMGVDYAMPCSKDPRLPCPATDSGVIPASNPLVAWSRAHSCESKTTSACGILSITVQTEEGSTSLFITSDGTQEKTAWLRTPDGGTLYELKELPHE